MSTTEGPPLEHLRKATASALVVETGVDDPVGFVEIALRCGGSWKLGVEAWRRSGLRFLVLMAPTPERLEQSHPYAILAADEAGLLQAVRTACAMLDEGPGGFCAWCRALSPQVLAAVDAEISGHERADFAASTPQGNA